jgi:hypothetical protein
MPPQNPDPDTSTSGGARRRRPGPAAVPSIDAPVYPYKDDYGDYFELLGVSLREVREGSADGVSIRFHAPTETAIRQAYRRFVLEHWTPALSTPLSFLTAAGEKFRSGVEAYLTLISPSARLEYVELALKPLDQGGGRAEGGHLSWVKSNRRRPYISHPIPDSHVLVVEDVLAAAEDVRGEYGDDIDALRDWFKGELEALPSYLRADRLEPVDILQAEGLIRSLVLAKADLQPLRPYRIVVDWRRSAWKSYGSPIAAAPKPLSAADRERWPLDAGNTPSGRITLALDHWLACDGEERETLVFKALCLLEASDEVVKLRHPEVRTSVAAVDEYGLTSQAEADLVAVALGRATLPLELARWGHNLPRQTFLFGSGG